MATLEKVEKKLEKKQNKKNPQCLKCGTKALDRFYKSLNSDHMTGFLPYCKACVKEKFKDYFYKVGKDQHASLYLLCRVVDIPYKENMAIEAIDDNNKKIERARDENKERYAEDVYSSYFERINNLFRQVDDVHLSFEESDFCENGIKFLTKRDDKDIKDLARELLSDEEVSKRKELEELRERFGNYKDDELLWLKNEYVDWESSNNLNTMTLVKMAEEIAKTRLAIRQATKPSDLKSYHSIFNDLLKQTGLSPTSNSNLSDTTKNTIGMRIKDLEENKPADIVSMRPKYSDIDNHEKYYQNYFRAPLLKSLGRDNEDTQSMEKEIKQYKISGDELASVLADGDRSGEDSLDDED